MPFCDGVLKANKLYPSLNGMIAQQVTEITTLANILSGTKRSSKMDVEYV